MRVCARKLEIPLEWTMYGVGGSRDSALTQDNEVQDVTLGVNV